MGGYLGGIAQVVGAAAAGKAKGKAKRQEIDREDMQRALVESHRVKQEELENRRLTNQDRDRNDQITFRREDALERGKDRDADRAERARESDQRAAEVRDYHKTAKEGREYRPDEREKAADEFAYRMIEARGGDPVEGMRAAERDMPTARKLGMRRDHYYAAAQRYKDRLVAKSKPTVQDDELNGVATPAAPARAATAPKSYSSDPDTAAAQRMWDNSPTLQKARKRP